MVDLTLAKRLDALLTRRGLLNKSQRGFVLNGNCYQVIARVNMIYEVALRDGRDARHLYLDATAAFDSVPHVSFDVSFDRLGVPEDLIGSHRGIIGGHTRV